MNKINEKLFEIWKELNLCFLLTLFLASAKYNIIRRVYNKDNMKINKKWNNK